MINLFLNVNNQLRGFYWFVMKSMDLYWGPSNECVIEKAPVDLIDNISLKNLLADDFCDWDRSRMKFSYHKSGQLHLKKTKSKDDCIIEKSSWISCSGIKSPLLFYAVISKSPKLYNPYNKKPKKKSHNIAIKVSEINLDKRIYFEFFIAPKGRSKLPGILLNTNADMQPTQKEISLNESYDLIIRFFSVSLENTDLSMGKEIFLIADSLE